MTARRNILRATTSLKAIQDECISFGHTAINEINALDLDLDYKEDFDDDSILRPPALWKCTEPHSNTVERIRANVHREQSIAERLEARRSTLQEAHTECSSG